MIDSILGGGVDDVYHCSWSRGVREEPARRSGTNGESRVIVLDANVISEFFKPQPDGSVIAWLESLTGDVAITAIKLAELLAGVRRLPDSQRKSALNTKINAVLQRYRKTQAVLALDDEAATHYPTVLGERERLGLPVTMAEAQIATICRAHDAVCATRKVKDFEHAGIELINPWDS